MERREFMRVALASVVSAFVGAGIGSAAVRAITPPIVTKEVETVEVEKPTPMIPWPYVELDPAEVASRAYHGYYEICCCYGVGEAILGTLRDKIGFPYTTVPLHTFHFGCGGLRGWGHVCGAIVAASVAAAYLGPPGKKPPKEEIWPVVTEVYRYFENELMPNPEFVPKPPYPEKAHPELEI